MLNQPAKRILLKFFSGELYYFAKSTIIWLRVCRAVNLIGLVGHKIVDISRNFPIIIGRINTWGPYFSHTAYNDNIEFKNKYLTKIKMLTIV